MREIISPKRGNQILLASDHLEQTREVDELGGGFLTRTLIRGLQREFDNVDRDGDGLIPAEELTEWMKLEAEKFNRANPSAPVPLPFLYGYQRAAFVVATKQPVPPESSPRERTILSILNECPIDCDLAVGLPVRKELLSRALRVMPAPLGKVLGIIDNGWEGLPGSNQFIVFTDHGISASFVRLPRLGFKLEFIPYEVLANLTITTSASAPALRFVQGLSSVFFGTDGPGIVSLGDGRSLVVKGVPPSVLAGILRKLQQLGQT